MKNIILNFKKYQGKLTPHLLRKLLKVSRKTVHKHLARMIGLGLLRRIGYGLYQLTRLGWTFKFTKNYSPKCHPPGQSVTPLKKTCYHYIDHVLTKLSVDNLVKEKHSKSRLTSFEKFKKDKIEFCRQYLDRLGYLKNAKNPTNYILKVLWSWFRDPNNFKQSKETYNKFVKTQTDQEERKEKIKRGTKRTLRSAEKREREVSDTKSKAAQLRMHQNATQLEQMANKELASNGYSPRFISSQLFDLTLVKLAEKMGYT